MQTAFTMAQFGALRHADHCGANIGALIGEARVWLSAQVKLRDDADPAVVAQLSRPTGAPPE
jgi:hypothetical protein